jgi:DivIVA domain-containing protein
VQGHVRVTGDEVRAATFPFRFNGYSPLEVEAWLNRVADIIDSGVQGSDYPRETFLKVMRGYDAPAVDRFMTALTGGGTTADVLAAPSRTPALVRKKKAQPAKLLYANAAAWRYHDGRDKPFRQRYRQECDAEWARFPHLPGTRLRITRGQVVDGDGRILTTADRGKLTVVASWRVVRVAGTRTGHEFVDDRTGELIISGSGNNVSFEAEAAVTRADQPWLWFPVQGTSAENAVMHAIDASGAEILSFRRLGRADIEVVVAPDQTVALEILCVIAAAGGWLGSFFESMS